MPWPRYDEAAESRVVETIPTFARVFAPESITTYARLNTPITAYENMKLVFEGKTPCWLPGDSEMFRFSPRMMWENEVRAFVMDADPKDTLRFGGKDYFGVEWTYEPNIHGSTVIGGSPLLDDANDWEGLVRFPDLDAWDWAGCAEKNRPYISDRSRMMTMTVYTGFFERLISFMDFENAAIAMIDPDQQDAVKGLFDKLTDFYVDMLDRIHTYFRPDVISIHDDWGAQRSAFFSLDTCREMVVPYLRRFCDACHERGIYMNFHCCGKNNDLVPAMIEAGIDMWYPQPVNDVDAIFDRAYGKFVIGVPAPPLRPDAPEEEIRAALQARLAHYRDRPSYATSAGIFFVDNPAVRRYQSLMYAESRKFYADLP